MTAKGAVRCYGQTQEIAAFTVRLVTWPAHQFSLVMIVVPDRMQDDMVARPMPFFLAWGLPLLLLLSMNFAAGTFANWIIILVMSGSFLWMGVACLFNATRCRRRHCFYSGPIFLMGAIGVLIVGFQVISIGSDGLTIVVWSTLGLVLATFLTEIVQGKYISK